MLIYCSTEIEWMVGVHLFRCDYKGYREALQVSNATKCARIHYLVTGVLGMCALPHRVVILHLTGKKLALTALVMLNSVRLVKWML